MLSRIEIMHPIYTIMSIIKKKLSLIIFAPSFPECPHLSLVLAPSFPEILFELGLLHLHFQEFSPFSHKYWVEFIQELLTIESAKT